MHPARPLAALLLASLPAAWQVPEPVPLTLDTVLDRSVSFAPEWSERWEWAPDEQHLLRIRGEERTWIDPRTGEAVATPPETLPDGSSRAERGARRKELRETLAQVEGIDDALARRLSSNRIGEEGEVEFYEADGLLVRVDANDEVRIVLEPGPSSREFMTLTDDASRLVFVQDNDVFVHAADSGALLARTEGGGPSLFHGKLDWVYQEEIYGRGDFKAFWPSASGAHVAFLELDESPVYEFTVIDHVEDGHFRVKPEITHYPKSGDPNPIVRLGVLEVKTGATRWLDLGLDPETEPLVVRVGWTPAGALLFVVQDRLQTMADVRLFDPRSDSTSTWIQERSRSWVDRPEEPHWLSDGSFLWESSRTGYNHLYHYSAEGRFKRAVTAGKWKVNSIESIDEEHGFLRFYSTRDGADERHLYRIGLDGTGLVHLTPGKGWHQPRFGAADSLILDSYSSLGDPGRVQLVDAQTGKVVRELAQASAARWDSRGLVRWRSLQVPTRDGLLLDAALLEPVLPASTTKAPLWIMTYSGPDAPSVRERWNASAWSAFLASQGIAVFQLNVRTASGLGHWAIEQVYLHMGTQELADFEDALDWLAGEYAWFDAARVGMTGYSYGGFMTAFAMTHSKRFRLGIAGGGVYDWGLYDTIYTERYMSTPQKNPEGYAGTSVLKAAKDLSGHLLIAHGVMDDNVHVQNAMQLIYALQKAGKSFELMLYPQARHGIRDSDQRAFDQRLNWRVIQEHLLGAK